MDYVVETQEQSGGVNPIHEIDSDVSRETIVESNLFWHLDNVTHEFTYFPDTCFDKKTLSALIQNETGERGTFKTDWAEVKGENDWSKILNNLNTGKWTGFFPISRRPRGANYPRPKRHFKLIRFFMKHCRFPEDLCLRQLPKEPVWFRFSWFFFGYYISNIIEKIMLQAIGDEEELRDRVVNFYPNIGIISALIAGISLGSYFNGFSSNETINTIFGFCTLASGACGLFSTTMATAYLLILLGIPTCATDEFMMANLWFLGIPIFTMFGSLGFLMIALIVIASPLYSIAVLVLIAVLATPITIITLWAIYCLVDSTMVTALDSLVESRDKERGRLNEDGSIKLK